MRISIAAVVRVTLIVGAIALAGLHDARHPARADAPGPSFSVDLNAGQAGIQSTRSMPVGTPFSISIWLDTIGIPSYFSVDLQFYWDDARLTAPLSGVPLDWSDPPEPGPIGGRIVPFPHPECPPFDAETAISGEDGVGTAMLYVSCVSSFDPVHEAISYAGPLMEFVFRCDATGTAAITIQDQGMFTVITELLPTPPNPPGSPGNSYFDHAHNATVTCTAGGGDADADGMPDVYESQYPCLNVNIADATADPDADDYVNITEYQVGTNPCDLDTDNDGCADSEEDPARSPMIGGQRDPNNGYDFYDVNGSQKVDGADIGLVRFNFNSSGPTPPEDLIYDRSTGAAPWAPNGPDNKINAADIGMVRTVFNHTCAGAPN